MSEGWGFPGGSRKAHYFRQMTSLCRRWGFYAGHLEADNGTPSPDDCAACRRVLDREAVSKAEVQP